MLFFPSLSFSELWGCRFWQQTNGLGDGSVLNRKDNFYQVRIKTCTIHASLKTADLCMYWLLNVLHWCVVGNNVGNGGLDLLGFRYLIEQDFPGSRVGPEPTTDCFSALMYGDVEGIIPGNALTVDPKKPFRNLDPFGNAFLNRWLKSTDRRGKEERGRWRESETKGN